MVLLVSIVKYRSNSQELFRSKVNTELRVFAVSMGKQ